MTLPLKLNSQLCSHAYNEAVEKIARLAAYATSRSLAAVGFGDYFHLAEELAQKDLIILCISTRRLAEMTKSNSNLKKKQVKSAYKKTDGTHHTTQVNCWDIIGNILHGVEIVIYKDTGKYTEKDILKAIENTDEIDAAISIKSDKFERKIFSLTDFLKCLNDYIDEANDILADNKIFLGSYYK
jgi:CRISPR/Cas system CSM-associated protein Csm2 small subunit